MAQHGAITNEGLAVLCSEIKTNGETADNAGTAVVRLSELMQQGFREVNAALNDFPNVTAFTIPAVAGTTAWGLDNEETSDYKWHFDITDESVTPYDVAIVNVSRVGLNAAKRCGLCKQNETLTGKIRLRAVAVPPESIAAEYYVCPGKEPAAESEKEEE